MDYRARFYSPVLGRFTQPDTIIPDLTNSQAWNRYSYVNNSPIMYVDPSGHIVENGATGGNATEENLKRLLDDGKNSNLNDKVIAIPIELFNDPIGCLFAPIDQCPPGYWSDYVHTGWEYNEDVQGDLAVTNIDLGVNFIVKGLAGLLGLPESAVGSFVLLLGIPGSTPQGNYTEYFPSTGIDDLGLEVLDETVDGAGTALGYGVGLVEAASDADITELYCQPDLSKVYENSILHLGFFPGRMPNSIPGNEVALPYETYFSLLNSGQLKNHSIMELSVFDSMEDYVSN